MSLSLLTVKIEISSLERLLHFVDSSSTETEDVKEEAREETPMDTTGLRPPHVHDADPTYYWGRGHVMEGEGQDIEGKEFGSTDSNLFKGLYTLSREVTLSQYFVPF